MKYHNLYRGIVIQNNDPKKAGRVKVFVPGINITQLKNWNEKKEEDKFFKTLGKNTNSSLSLDIITDQKNKLFWASTIMPNAGSGTAGIYDASKDINVIGNDSGYIIQESSKNDEFFKKDERDFIKRENQKIQNPSYGSSPFSVMAINFSFSGKRYCSRSSCNGTIPGSFWQDDDKEFQEIIKEIPKTFDETDVVLDEQDSSNAGITGIIMDVVNPTIFFNDVELPKDSPLYNPDCYPVFENTDSINFSPPIYYQETDDEAKSNYNDIPVQISINGKLSVNDEFKLESYDDQKMVYKKDNLKIHVPNNSLNSITIKHNGNRFDINRILALIPLLRTAINLVGNLIMPRAPYPRGQVSLSRTGGGAALYNNVATNLLPTNQRLQSHIKGANNESKTQINKGRIADNDVNKTKGNNITGKIDQAHRGPMRCPDYTNEWKGMISIPGVGSHVWVGFENGDTNFPFIFGTIVNSVDVKGIYEGK